MQKRFKVQHKRIMLSIALVLVLAFGGIQVAPAVNITVTNVTLSQCIDPGQTVVQFDVSWDASWRASWTEFGTWTNWDAAWIFVKYRQSGASGWSHATLSTSISEYSSPAGSEISIGMSTNSGGTNFGAGVFLYRSAEGSGSWTNTNVKLRWRYADDGVINTSKVDVTVLAIEMVYVPKGGFYVGTSGTESGSFTDGSWVSGNTIPFLITSEAELMVTNTAGYLWGTSTNGNNSIGPTNSPIPAAYPKGFNAFYCMKYEITQGQYTDFLNMLTAAQATTRYYVIAPLTNRYTLSGPYPNITNTAPDRACNFLSWADGTAYADWAGLRPMTELEFEKACRGTMMPVVNEYAWGSATVQAITNFVGIDGSGTETALPANANCNYGYLLNSEIGNTNGPVRVGIYATATSGRTGAGATYWGIMEMSGNLWERPVTVGNATGRLFTGTHGDGVLDSSGNPTADLWPGTSASGAGFRGGNWVSSTDFLRSSGRICAAYVGGIRFLDFGFRAARLAP